MPERQPLFQRLIDVPCAGKRFLLRGMAAIADGGNLRGNVGQMRAELLLNAGGILQWSFSLIAPDAKTGGAAERSLPEDEKRLRFGACALRTVKRMRGANAHGQQDHQREDNKQ